MKKGIRIAVVLYCFLPCFFLSAADNRTVPINVYLIVDASPAMGDKRAEAVTWLCDNVIDGLLMAGDNLAIVSAADKPVSLFSGVIGGPDTKEAAKTALRSAAAGGSADYAGALREAASRQAARSDGRLNYTLLASGSALPASGGLASLLRFSRVQEFPGWRLLTVGLGIERQVREAAAAYTR
jgi:hypothetical protein